MFDFVSLLFFLAVISFVNIAIIFSICLSVGFVLDKINPDIQNNIPDWVIQEIGMFLFFIVLPASEIYLLYLSNSHS